MSAKLDEKALVAAFRVNHHELAEPSETELRQLRAAITAYLAACPGSTGAAEGWCVKPLRWVDQGKVPAEAWGDSVLRQFIGHHDLGRYAGSYCVQEREPGGPWGWWCTWTSDREPEGIEPTEDAVKAACQAHFGRCILSTLSAAGESEG